MLGEAPIGTAAFLPSSAADDCLFLAEQGPIARSELVIPPDITVAI
jgi:hypothetical protein